MKTLLIDDLRDFPSADCVARSYDVAIDCLKSRIWDLVLLDHDLGHIDPKKTGYDILNWLECHPCFMPKNIVLVTMNPVGRQKMQPVINNLMENYNNGSLVC